MAETIQRERLDEERLFEEAFLLMAQTQIQRLLNEKQLRYRDLSKRLGVSEARVSQMLGDEAANLTIRTIARIFRQLDEVPVIMTRREVERISRSTDVADSWTMMSDEVRSFTVTGGQVIDDGESFDERGSALARDWMNAEPLLVARS